MKRILVALCALSICAVSSAQYESADLSDSAVGFSLRLGAFFPADNQMRDIDNMFINVGIEYEFERSFVRNGITYMAGEWIADEVLGAHHVGNITINQRIYTKDQRFAAGGSPYFFGGVGFQWLSVPGLNDNGWVVRGGLGSEFSGDYFLEVGGYFSPDMQGFNTSGVCASVGYRFRSK